MARRSKDRYLVLIVDDSKQDCLHVRLAIGVSERLNFLGEACDSEIVIPAWGSGAAGVKLPWPGLLQMDFLMPRRKGVEVLEWLQSQPLKDLVVVLLPVGAGAEDFTGRYECSVGGEDGESLTGATELLKFLQDYAANRTGGK